MATFFTSIGCMDGRIQEVVANHGRGVFGAEYADTITEAGFMSVLAKHALDPDFVEKFSEKLFISVTNHNSKGIIMHAHQDCAGNPVSNEQQRMEVQEAAQLIKSIVVDLPVVGVFLSLDPKDASHWIVEEVVNLE